MAVFEVADVWPLRSDISDMELAGGGDPTLAEQLQTPLPTPDPVLGSGTGTRFEGELGADRRIAQAETADPGWSLTVDGEQADASPLLGWQRQYVTGEGGRAELAWSTPLLSRLLQVLQLVALLALIVLAARRRRLVAPAPRRRRRRIEDPLVVVAADGEVLSSDKDVLHSEPGSTGATPSTGEVSS